MVAATLPMPMPELVERHNVPLLPLRDYQEAAIAAIRANYGTTKRQLVVMATGAGKTVTFAHLVARRPGRALVLAHRDELIEQAIGKLRAVLGQNADVGKVKAAEDRHGAEVVVASVQTLARERRRARLGAFRTIIVDEAHHAAADTYRAILEELGAFGDRRLRETPLVVGWTATADRGDGVGLDCVFEEIVYEIGMLPLIERGYLCDMRAIRIKIAGADFGSLKLRHGDVSESEAGRMFVDANGPTAVAEALVKHAGDRKSIVFTPTVAAAEATANALIAQGIWADAISGATPDDVRRDRLERLRDGRLRAIVNCMVLTEGFDEPSVDCVVVARPTVNRALYQQMVGRASRIYPGKVDALVLDCVGATQRHDLVSLPSLFGLSPNALEDGEGVARAVARKRERGEVVVDEQTGKIIAEPAGLFGARRANWVPASGGRWVLSAGEATIVLIPQDVAGDRWRAVLKPRDTRTTDVLADGLPLGYCQGIAEDEARKLGAGSLVRRDAPWRAQPASEKQLAALMRWGIEIRPGLTRGEASDLISARSARGVR